MRTRSGDRVIARDRVIEKVTPNAFSASQLLRGEAVRSASRLSKSRVPITRSPDHPITQSQHASSVARQVLHWLQGAWQVILAALREVFDENAYERYLMRTQEPRSTQSYRAFLREHQMAVARKPKCC